MDQIPISSTEDGKNLAKNIIDDLEINEVPISKILMKTIRLARLLNDPHAQLWLNYVLNGYPKKFDPKELGAYKKFYLPSWRTKPTNSGNNEMVFTLPVIESFIKNKTFEKLFPSHSENSAVAMEVINMSHTLVRRYEQEKMFIHIYVIDVFLSLSIGDIVEDIFKDSRMRVDRFIQEKCSTETKQKLLAINDRLKENNPESFSHALLSCRRILESIADSIYPPKDEIYVGKDGKKHEIGKNNYVNRILAYIDLNSSSQTKTQLQLTNFQHLVARLDALNDESQKGVHDNITKEEAQLTIIQMYLFIAEIIRTKCR
jgi:hypothetical protein